MIALDQAGMKGRTITRDAAMTAARKVARFGMAALIVVLALVHFSFSMSNLRFVERLPEDLDVLLEGIAAAIAAISLVWAAVNHIRRAPWAAIALGGASAFAAGMLLSVSTGASSPDMLVVVLPSMALGAGRLLFEAAVVTSGT